PTLPQRSTSLSLSIAAGRMAVATSAALYLYQSLDAPPQSLRPATAVTAKPDGSQFYALEANGTVRLVDPVTGQDTQTLNGRGPAGAIAFALGPDRLFTTRTDTPSLDVFDLDAHSVDTVSLANDRTGAFTTGAT